MMAVNKVLAKRRGPGRPRKDDPIRSVVAVALSTAVLAQLDEWMAEKGITSRSEAVRGFVEHGLNAAQKAAARRAKRKG
jgi:metal-responsive CopG/Arc/MetJ family transcriptional regulator